MKLLAEFSINLVKTEEKLYFLMPYMVRDAERTITNATELEQVFLQILLFDRSSFSGFDNASQLRLRFFCIEFAACYQSKRIHDAVSPNAMLAYLCGAQLRLRVLGLPVNLFTGPIFTDPEYRLVAVLHNKFSEQQARGRTIKAHNVLCAADMCAILDSEHCNAHNARGRSKSLAVYRRVEHRRSNIRAAHAVVLAVQARNAQRSRTACLPAHRRLRTWSV